MNVGQSFTCPACRIRYQVGSPVSPDAPCFAQLDGTSKMRTLRQFAAEFDRLADRCWTATDFLDWLEPSVTGTERHRVTLNLTDVGELR